MSSSRRSNERQRERNMSRHQETGWRDCKGCGKSFLPPFGHGSGATRYCPDPDCQAIKYEAVRESKAKALERYKARNGRGRSEKKVLKPCRSLELRGYKHWHCDGKIHNENWRFCADCEAGFLAFNGGPTEYQTVETLDIANMGLMPC